MKFAAPLIIIATASLAQTPEKKAALDVVAIRMSQQDDGQDVDSDQGLFRAHNLTAKRLISLAYTIDMSQVLGGPKWLDSDRYDINAKIPAEFAQQTGTRLPEMIESLLADRFQLSVHREPREVSGFALVTVKKGPKMSPAKPEETGPGMHSNGRHLTATGVTMEALARRLAREAGGPVIDRTGLAGRFDFELDWTPERLAAAVDTPADGPPSIFTALQDQLGLKLESSKVPVSAVIVDRAEKPQTD